MKNVTSEFNQLCFIALEHLIKNVSYNTITGTIALFHHDTQDKI